jgi:hypothetical protein
MRTCTICRSDKRLEVDKALIAGQSIRDIAGRFRLTKSAVERHKSEHLPVRLAKAAGERERKDSASLLDRLADLRRDAAAVLEQARGWSASGGDCERCAVGPNVQLKAIGRLEQLLTLEAKLAGELRDSPVINVISSPEWIRLRSVVLVALQPFPEAAAAVVEAIGAAAGGSDAA